MDIGPSATKTRMDKESLTYELDISLSAQGHKLCGAIDKGKKKGKKKLLSLFLFSLAALTPTQKHLLGGLTGCAWPMAAATCGMPGG